MLSHRFPPDPNTPGQPSRRPLSKEELHRAVRKKPAPKPLVYKRDLSRVSSSPAKSQKELAGSIDGDEDLTDLPGEEHLHNQFGKAFILKTLSKSHKVLHYISREFRTHFHNPESGLRAKIASMGCQDLLPEHILFMDIESTGLGSSPLFLIGVLQWENSGFVVHQFLARDYSEETAVLAFFLDRLPSSTLLVTFNGKSFDVPYLRMRSAANSLKTTDFPLHIDLLHESRRVWKKDLPDCKLQTLERHICRRVRHDDIPGQEIAQAYHDFVRTGHTGKMKRILKHNLLDLATLAELLTRLPKP